MAKYTQRTGRKQQKVSKRGGIKKVSNKVLTQASAIKGLKSKIQDVLYKASEKKKYVYTFYDIPSRSNMDKDDALLADTPESMKTGHVTVSAAKNGYAQTNYLGVVAQRLWQAKAIIPPIESIQRGDKANERIGDQIEITYINYRFEITCGSQYDAGFFRFMCLKPKLNHINPVLSNEIQLASAQQSGGFDFTQRFPTIDTSQWTIVEDKYIPIQPKKLANTDNPGTDTKSSNKILIQRNWKYNTKAQWQQEEEGYQAGSIGATSSNAFHIKDFKPYHVYLFGNMGMNRQSDFGQSSMPQVNGLDYNFLNERLHIEGQIQINYTDI